MFGCFDISLTFTIRGSFAHVHMYISFVLKTEGSSACCPRPSDYRHVPAAVSGCPL